MLFCCRCCYLLLFLFWYFSKTAIKWIFPHVAYFWAQLSHSRVKRYKNTRTHTQTQSQGTYTQTHTHTERAAAEEENCSYCRDRSCCCCCYCRCFLSWILKQFLYTIFHFVCIRFVQQGGRTVRVGLSFLNDFLLVNLFIVSTLLIAHAHTRTQAARTHTQTETEDVQTQRQQRHSQSEICWVDYKTTEQKLAQH